MKVSAQYFTLDESKHHKAQATFMTAVGQDCSFRPSFVSLLWKTYPATTRTTSLTLKAMRERKRCSQSMEDRVEYGTRKY